MMDFFISRKKSEKIDIPRKTPNKTLNYKVRQAARHGIIEQADLKTFLVVHVEMEDGIMKFGKDKFNYYFWDEIVTDTVGFGLKTREITKAQQ